MSYSKGTEKEAYDMEDGTIGTAPTLRNKSSHGSSMASSVVRFHDVNFVVGKGDKRRNILENVSGKVKWGRKSRRYTYHETRKSRLGFTLLTTPLSFNFRRCPRNHGPFWCWVSHPHHLYAQRLLIMIGSCPHPVTLSFRKTTLISALTLDAFYGKPSGSVTLNGVPLTDKLFKRYCYGELKLARTPE